MGNRDGTSNQDPLEVAKVSAPTSGRRTASDPRLNMVPSWGRSDVDWSRRNHSAGYAAKPYEHATVEPVQDGAQSRMQGHA